MLGDKEYQFLKDLEKGDITKYSDSYKRRIVKVSKEY
jgi:hypothetical protein